MSQSPGMNETVEITAIMQPTYRGLDVFCFIKNINQSQNLYFAKVTGKRALDILVVGFQTEPEPCYTLLQMRSPDSSSGMWNVEFFDKIWPYTYSYIDRYYFQKRFLQQDA